MTQIPQNEPLIRSASEQDISGLSPISRLKRSKEQIASKSCHSLAPKSKTKKETPERYSNYILNNLRNLINDDCLNDVTFIVEDEEFSGIRSLFGCQSIVFRQMLYGSMMESQPENDVVLHDITIEAFKYLRNTFYNIFDNDLTPFIVVDVLYAAKKYLIKPLVKKCIHFIKNITNIDDWYFVLNIFEQSPCAQDFINLIVNVDDSPYILQHKSLKYIQDKKFKYLKHNTIIIFISSDNLAANEDEIWEALLIWTRFNTGNKNKNKNKNKNNIFERDEKELESEELESENEETESENMNLNESEKHLMNNFITFIRFNQMSSNFLKKNIVEKKILKQDDIINIMFARENATKFKSKFNDSPRNKPKALDTFQLNEICLTLKQIKSLSVGDLIDFRDFYGLFCGSSVIDIDHSQNKIKIHYNSWGSTYDEWYTYICDTNTNTNTNANTIDNEGKIILAQKDKNYRIAQFGSVTNRQIQREYFRDRIEQYKSGTNDTNNECQVKLSNWFWKKNENYIANKHLYMNKWLNAKVIGYKTATKYSHHIKIGIYINDDHFEYWIHPDNAEEIQPIPSNHNANRY
eukprot:170379_1